MPSFAISISILGLVQAALVSLPVARPRPSWIDRLSSPGWALIPALSIVVVIGAIEIAPGSADVLTYIALVAVPPLAAYALAILTRVRVNPPYTGVHTDSRSDAGWLAPISVVVALFVLAWVSPYSLAGEAAATALSGLGCVTLGWLLVCGVPASWLRLGVYAMAAIDVWFVAADLLQGPNAVLNAAAPAADLPRLQAVHFGSALMGFGDLFVAALVGCLLARSRPRQLEAALLVAALALAFDLLFFAVDQLPATVPVAVALAIVTRRGQAGLSRRDQAVREPG
ncbi:MAG: hypothetical protein QOF13_1793 [Solirubrobacterales bacterium]|jgi:hypothetical protein|nr:hypothetical protein [Solirubrobacterales bacterium]